MNQTARPFTTENPREISIEALYDSWRQLGNDEVIVDIRTSDDYQQAHVPDSRNIPFASMNDRCDELKPYRRIYFYCYGGQGSKAVATRLTEMGFENLCYVGQAGLADWQASGYPVTKL